MLEAFEASRSQGVVDMYMRVAGHQLTLRDMALRHGQSVGFPQIVGTPAQVVDQLEAYYEQAGGDGFMLTMAYTPGAIEEFVALVIPVLVVDEYVHAAHEAGLREVRLIHGRGKGVQRGIVQAALEKHELVEEFWDAAESHLGATVARLRT